MSPAPTMPLNEYRRFVQEHYPRRHPELFHLSRGFFRESFVAAHDAGSEEALRGLLRLEGQQAYSFEMLQPDFCRLLIEETKAFGDWCVQSGLHPNVPNTMNNYGAVLDDFGFGPCLQELMNEYVTPFASFLYADAGGDSLDHHHGFVVDYEIGKDEELDFHVDQSDVTLNVCLGESFSGGELYFGGIRCAVHQTTMPRPEEELSVQHRPGRAVLHRGKHRHAARKITQGRRMNLILWCMSTAYQQAYDPEQCTPWCCYQGD